jgi:hypothetical protein
MSARVFGFASTDSVRMVCECGSMDGKVELAQFGMRILFRCYDCNTHVLMEVTK